MGSPKLHNHGNVLVPIRTKPQPSPMKQAVSSRQPGQLHAHTTVGDAIDRELAKTGYLADDLADHVFGHIVSTELAKDILGRFVDDGVVQVFEGTASCHNQDDKVALDPSSNDVQSAIHQAFAVANRHGFVRPDTGSNAGKSRSLSANTKGKRKQADSKGKGKRKQKMYSFKWSTFPAETINEDELVSFLNEITDHAFAFAKSKLSKLYPKLNNRLAARGDQGRAISRSYEQDREDMQPDFLVLPFEAFTDAFKTVGPGYINFITPRRVGESKNRDQVQRYVRDWRRAKPRMHYVLAMAITRDKAVFIRGEGSGTELLELILADGRGCIELIRILLGLALANKVDLGHNPEVDLESEVRICGVNNDLSPSSNAPTTSCMTMTRNMDSVAVSASDIPSSSAFPISSRTRSASAASKQLPISSRTRSALAAARAPPISSRTRSAPAASKILPSSSSVYGASASLRPQVIAASTSSSRRLYSEIMEGNHEETRPKRRKLAETVTGKEERMVLFPVRAYRHTCLGIFLTSSSVRGRGTTVFRALVLDKKNWLASKMSWRDLERVADQAGIMRILEEHKSRPNATALLKTFTADGKTRTTLGAIRGFLDEQIDHVLVENRVLTVSVSKPKRPVRYFWGVHDFVRGLRCAMLGHEYLTKIGILHRDISENNIVLGVYPWEERGYLIDFDMAILQTPEKPTTVSSTESASQIHQPAEQSSAQLAKPDEQKHAEGLRTGALPYVSFSVLLGATHTHSGDVESFLYVLLLFFFSYAGPLPKQELEDAHKRGFVQPIGSGPLPHLRKWPKKFAGWADGDPRVIGKSKALDIWSPNAVNFLDEGIELYVCLKKNWPADLHCPIRVLLEYIFTLFRTSVKTGRPEVSHKMFIEVLEAWLVVYSALESKYSNCPEFRDSRNMK